LILEVLDAGYHTSVQDLGRWGYRGHGVPTGGAADLLALRVANELVGNPPDAAGLEFVNPGPVLRCSGPCTVAVFGAWTEFPRGRAEKVRRNGLVDLRVVRCGRYGYLAVRGGIQVPQILGSRSTDTRAGWGGLEGRILRKGDRLPVGKEGVIEPIWGVTAGFRQRYDPEQPVRFVRDEHWTCSFAGAREYALRVEGPSDRMGVRLTGPVVSPAPDPRHPSLPVFPGSIQVPTTGKALILLADAQTLGGYPVMGRVISADLHRVAQALPGTELRLVPVTLATAWEALASLERSIAVLSIHRRAME
jgi:antagonist of KipI